MYIFIILIICLNMSNYTICIYSEIYEIPYDLINIINLYLGKKKLQFIITNKKKDHLINHLNNIFILCINFVNDIYIWNITNIRDLIEYAILDNNFNNKIYLKYYDESKKSNYL